VSLRKKKKKKEGKISCERGINEEKGKHLKEERGKKKKNQSAKGRSTCIFLKE
jgi:hypothetical protein